MFVRKLKIDNERMESPILKKAVGMLKDGFSEEDIKEFLRVNLSEFEKGRCLVGRHLYQVEEKGNILDKIDKIIYNVINNLI